MRNIQEIDRELERARQKMERSRKLDVILQDLKEQSGRRRRAEEEKARMGRVYQALGLTGGGFLVILLL